MKLVPVFGDGPGGPLSLFNHTMDAVSEELKVTFFPPLYLQRRIWILETLRQQAVTSVLDVGCGEGELLSVLCQPALWLPAHPDSTDILSKNEFIDLHPTYITGLDISTDLEFAIRGTTPSFHGVTRWESLEVNIWKGGLESLNPEFVDVECIVAMEVIEHLPEDILSEFAPMMLGVYHPHLLLVTTPSYTFNARFTAPNAPASARSGYPDPTGRTTRIFRHHDHKFEWTVEEFQKWCNAAAEEWGYTVETSTVGRASELDEWGRDEELGGASQVARFQRLDDKEYVEKRASKRNSVAERASQKTMHELLATHFHAAHPRSQKPGSLQEIGECVKLKMETYREAFMRLEELWFQQEIAILCGGWIELLVKAVKEHHKLKIHGDQTEKRSNWQVELIDGIQGNLWSTEEDEHSLDYIPPDYFPEDVSIPCKWETESSGIEGDISASNSDDEEDDDCWGNKSPIDSVNWGVERDGDWKREAATWGDSVDVGDESGENGES